MPEHIERRIAKRRRDAVGESLLRITAGRPGWVLIENEGALFRGPARNVPTEVWRERLCAWEPYRDPRGPKPYEWGYEIAEDEARRLVQAWATASPGSSDVIGS